MRFLAHELLRFARYRCRNLEAFVHGAMCIFLPGGRCKFFQSYEYGVMPTEAVARNLVVGNTICKDMPFGQERKSLKGEIPEEFSMSAVIMSMIDRILIRIENGVDSLENRRSMKSTTFLTVTKLPSKAAVDAYLESLENLKLLSKI